MKELILTIVKHLLPLSLGIGSVFLKYHDISGWGWFLFLSFILELINTETKEKEKNDIL